MAKKQKAKKPVKCKDCSKSKVSTLQEENALCGDWFFEIRGGIIYSCRWCVTNGPTAIPYKECIPLPE